MKTLERLKNKIKDQIGKTQPSGFKLLTNYYPKDAKDQIDDMFKIIESELSQPSDVSDSDIEKWAKKRYEEWLIMANEAHRSHSWEELLSIGAKAMQAGQITPPIERGSVKQEAEKEVPLTAEEISLKDKILEEAKKGNIVVSTFDGLMICPLKDVVEQPTEGLLYDINRDQATILTLINDPKWVNDYVCMQVIYELKSRLKMPQFQPKGIVLPNDEEIEKETHKRFESNTGYLNVDKAYAFIKGAKWLRDLIEKQK